MYKLQLPGANVWWQIRSCYGEWQSSPATNHSVCLACVSCHDVDSKLDLDASSYAREIILFTDNVCCTYCIYRQCAIHKAWYCIVTDVSISTVCIVSVLWNRHCTCWIVVLSEVWVAGTSCKSGRYNAACIHSNSLLSQDVCQFAGLSTPLSCCGIVAIAGHWS